MKTRPILFKGEMVRAILDGRKTQTRRILKPAPLPPVARWVMKDHWWIPEAISEAVKRQFITTWPDWLRCPYGQLGDQLWVRETWRIGAWKEDGGEIAIDYMADNFNRREWLQVPEQDDFEKYWLQCCDDCGKAWIKPDEDGKHHWEPGESPCRIRPSIFMPRWASRITLEVTNVRVERLQSITVSEAMAEGYEGSIPDHIDPSITWYSELWESINGPGSWAANPWVWVIEFKRLNNG